MGHGSVGYNPAGELYYINNDHLGTLQGLISEVGVIVWSASYAPFGLAQVDEDPDLNGIPVMFNLRFPGQYFDSESGFHYNYFRVYDPAARRWDRRWITTRSGVW